MAHDGNRINLKGLNNAEILLKEQNETIESMSQAQKARIIAKVLFEQLRGLSDRCASDRYTPVQAQFVLMDDFLRVLSPEMARYGFSLFDGNWDGKKIHFM
jgi:hypothetical protein